MTLEQVCSKFDRSHIVDTKPEIDREYYSATEITYSDGEVTCNITGQGDIHITSVHNANYFIFLDREYKTCLCIYKYAPTITYKYIIDNLHALKAEIDKIDDIMPCEECENDIDHTLIDINNFCCECGSKQKLVFTRSKTNYEALEVKCNECKSEYVFVPSKYYKLASKKVVYFKDEESSRKINITVPQTENNKTTNKKNNVKQRN